MVYSNSKMGGAPFLLQRLSSFWTRGCRGTLAWLQYICKGHSDLGVGPSAMVFGASVFLMGLLIIIAAYFLQRGFNHTVSARARKDEALYSTIFCALLSTIPNCGSSRRPVHVQFFSFRMGDCRIRIQ